MWKRKICTYILYIVNEKLKMLDKIKYINILHIKLEKCNQLDYLRNIFVMYLEDLELQLAIED